MNILERKIRQQVSQALGADAGRDVMRTFNSARYTAREAEQVANDLSRDSANGSAEDFSTPLLESASSGAEAAKLSGPASTTGHRRVRSTLKKPGLLAGIWRNPFLSVAMPTLLLIEQLLENENSASELDKFREQMAIEIPCLQRKLGELQQAPEDIQLCSYLLCSYADEAIVDERQRAGAPNTKPHHQSLLVTFHADAWGGDNCFNHLDSYLRDVPKNRAILCLYDLVLTMGFEGKYRMLESGAVLLDNVRTRLHTALYVDQEATSLALLKAPEIFRKQAVFPLAKIFAAGLLSCLLAYAISAWHLNETALPVQKEMLAWNPPKPGPVINVQQTLPAALQALIDEGWLQAVKKPYGWLLIFTSDNAFASGSAELTPSYQQKVLRIGHALAAWSGDLSVVGHTDTQKISRNFKYESNQQLSLARAGSVQKLLQSSANSKYPDRAIQASGKGDSDAIADNGTAEGRKRNRRVDILWKNAS